MENMITIFKDVHTIDTNYHVPVSLILNRIKNGKKKELVEQIRKLKDKDEKNVLKKQLPAICFSGTFSKRADKSIIDHSGLICLDFDDFETKKAVREFKDALKEDPYIYSVFISPSGKGLKALVKIPAEPDNHRGYFRALEEYYDSEHFDKSCVNISRVCYESYDPKIYINEDSDTWTDIVEEKVTEVKREIVEKTIAVDENKTIEYLRKWWDKNYGFIDGEWNNNLHVFACALCNYGIDKHTTYSYLDKIANEAGSMPSKDVFNLTESAYKSADFGTKVFEDKKKIDRYVTKVKKGEVRKTIKTELINEGVKEEDVDKVIGRIEQKAAEKTQVFWSKSDKGAISMNHILFKRYLSDNGFFKIYPKGSENFVLLRRQSNLIYNTIEAHIKDFVLDYLEGLQDTSIYNFFAERTKYFKYDFLGLMESVDVSPVRDDKDTAHLFYRNCVLVITKDDIKTVSYEDFDNWVWADQIINRDFEILSDSGCDYKRFIYDLGADEDDRIKSIESTIGYLLHSYKDPAYSPAVILNDEVISDNPEGGTGKGLFVNAIRRIKNTAKIDGKSFKQDGQFKYQTVKTDTQVLTFDDVKQNFNFELLFSVITEGITLEYKNKTAIKLEPEDSPKIVITTNYAIAGEGNSHERRKWELEFSQFYNRHMTPVERLGKRLFDEWNEKEWMRFDNYMVRCLQLYLAEGLVESKFVNLAQRKFHSETNKDFADWAEDPNNTYTKLTAGRTFGNEMYADFISMNPDFIRMKQKTFYNWLDKYGVYKYNSQPKRGRAGQGTWVEWVDKRKKSKPKQNKMEI